MIGKNSIMTGVGLWMEWLVHLAYPKRCPFCDRVLYSPLGEINHPVCSSCLEQVISVREPVCKRCGKPLSERRREYCPDCMRHAHAYEQGKSLWIYKEPVKESIYRFKYGNRREYGIFYGQELVRRYGEWIRRCGIQAIVPIPLHKKRIRQRGYNQAELIAREVGRQLQIPVESRLLIRNINTKPQKELNDRDRKNNLKKAFKISENKVQLECILLIDDIYTTGSTIDGAAAVLREAGVKKVFFASVSIGQGY